MQVGNSLFWKMQCMYFGVREEGSNYLPRVHIAEIYNAQFHHHQTLVTQGRCSHKPGTYGTCSVSISGCSGFTTEKLVTYLWPLASICYFHTQCPSSFLWKAPQMTGFSTSGDILLPEAFKLIFYYRCKCVLSNLPTAQ